MRAGRIVPRLSVRVSRDRHGIAHRVAVEDERSVVSADAGLEPRDGFIGSHLEDLGAASNRVTGPNRCLETPIHLKEYAARSREVFGHNRVEDCTRYAPLYDDLAKPARLRHALIVMKWIPVSADLGEPFNIFRVHRARALRDLPNAWDATRPDLIHVAAHNPNWTRPATVRRRANVIPVAAPSVDFDVVVVGARCA